MTYFILYLTDEFLTIGSDSDSDSCLLTPLSKRPLKSLLSCPFPPSNSIPTDLVSGLEGPGGRLERASLPKDQFVDLRIKKNKNGLLGHFNQVNENNKYIYHF